MYKAFCWRRRIDENDYLLLVLTSSLDKAKSVARQAGLPGPKKSGLVGMELTDPELSDVTVEPDVLYIADEEVFPIRFRALRDPRSPDR